MVVVVSGALLGVVAVVAVSVMLLLPVLGRCRCAVCVCVGCGVLLCDNVCCARCVALLHAGVVMRAVVRCCGMLCVVV